MAERVRSFDWSQTSLGPLQSWHDCQVSAVATLLESPFPQILLCGPEFIVCAYNDAYRPLLGNKPEALGRSQLEVWEETKDTAARFLKAAWAGTSCRVEGARFQLVRNGHPAEAFFDFSISPLRGPSGEMLGVLILVDETTDTAHHQRRLAESEQRLRAMVEASSDVIYRMSPDGSDVRDLRPAADSQRDLAGRAAQVDQGVGLSLGRQVHPDDRERVAAAMRQAIKSRSAFELEHRVLQPDGSRRWALSRAVPVLDERGEIKEWFGASSDVTARKLAEEALRDSEQHYRTLFDSMQEGFSISERVDNEAGQIVDFRVIAANPAFSQQTGNTEPVGKTLHELIPDDAAERIAIAAHVLRSGEPIREEGPFVSLGRILEVRAFRVEDGTNRRVAAMITDVTSRRKTEEALRKADREKTEFLAVLSHELRNPLAPLRTGVDLLKSVRADPGLLDTLRPMMERQLAHLVRLVDDLLDISRISRGKVELQCAEMDLVTPVEAAIEQTKPLIAAHRHNLIVQRSSTSLPIRGDLERLTQVVSNLLNNAANYSEPGGTITVSSASEEGQAVIRVRDSGYGIAPEQMPRIFEMFSQLPEHHRKSGGGGLGVGLALSRRLIELHGGTITAMSRGPGLGSEFTVRVPLEESKRPTESPRVSDSADGTRRVLVVDDNTDAAESLEMLLAMLGQQVATAHDGPSALQEIERFHPDLVLLDLGLPGMDGVEVARRARESTAGKNAAIMAVTGWGQEEDKARTREAGFNGHFTKPISAEQIRSILSSMA